MMAERLLILAWVAVHSALYIQAASLEGFQTTLSNLGYGRFAEAFKTVASSNSTIFASLGSGDPFTVYVPVNEAWGSAGDVDLEKVLAYHISPSPLNTTDIAPPRQHTIAYTQLRKDQALPGTQSQVLVLETAPTGDSRVLIRGPDWNATSTGPGRAYENIWIQPIDRVSFQIEQDKRPADGRILTPPLPLLDVLRLPLDGSAANGTTTFLAMINNVGLRDTLTGCKGCTFFVPNDGALARVNLTGLTAGQSANILLNHVINGDVRYSTELNPGNTWTSAAGQTVAYGVNATGAFVTSGGAVARIMRSDILASNGVVHLVNRVIGGTQANQDRAASALSAASQLAATQTAVEGVIGRVPTSAPAISQTGTASPFRPSNGAATRRTAPGPLIRLLLGA